MVGVLLGAAGVVACSGADDSVEQPQAGADSSGSGSDGGDGGGGDNGGGAPGIPGGESGGGAPGAPIDIPPITNLAGLPVDEVVDIMESRIRDACRVAGHQDLCLVVEVDVQGDGQDCEYRSDPPRAPASGGTPRS